MSIPQLSTEQRLQQLESTVISLLTQVSELSRQLESARSQRDDLQRVCDSLAHLSDMEQYIDEADLQNLPDRLDDLTTRVTEIDGGPFEQEDDSN